MAVPGEGAADRAAFVRLLRALAPWSSQLVVVGGWAHRLNRLAPQAVAPGYAPVVTLDADLAFGHGDRLEGDIRGSLRAAGFEQQLTGEHQPPVSRYVLGEGEPGAGFYAEFLVPLVGPSVDRDGRPRATLHAAGVTAQRLRYLNVLMLAPWRVTLGSDWGADPPLEVRVPNPAAFAVQKLLIHPDREPRKQRQDLLYLHDTLELFADAMPQLRDAWQADVAPHLDRAWIARARATAATLFSAPSDATREAARLSGRPGLTAERLCAVCSAMLDELMA